MRELIEARRKAAFAACPETGCDWGSFLRGWQAALDSVVVELPKQYDIGGMACDSHDRAIAICAEAIHAAGIKTKVGP